MRLCQGLLLRGGCSAQTSMLTRPIALAFVSSVALHIADDIRGLFAQTGLKNLFPRLS